jgi:glycosyltransferase involved in cell wall biosynthesis
VSKNVVLIIDRLGTGAGGEGTMLDFVRALSLSGFRVRVLVARSTWVQRRRLTKLALADSAIRGSVSVLPVARLLDFRVAPTVTVESWRQSSKPPLSTLRFLLDPRRLATRRALKQSDIVMVALTLTSRGLRQLQSFSNASLVLNHNGQPENFFTKWRRGLASPGHDTMRSYEKYLSAFQIVLFQSRNQEELFRRLYRSSSIKTATIWPGCDETAARAGAAKDSPFQPGRLNLLCVAKFQRSKGQFELIKAFSAVADEYPRVDLTFIGGRSAEYGYFDVCVDKVSELGLTNQIFFRGFQDDPYNFIAHCDVVVAVSSAEGVSRALREAAFLSRPIVCTRLDGSEDFLGELGAVYVQGDDLVDGIISALRRVLSDGSSLETLGSLSRLAYMEKASWPSFVSGVVDFFSRLEPGSQYRM